MAVLLSGCSIKGGACDSGALGSTGVAGGSGCRSARRLNRQMPTHSSARPLMPPTTPAMIMPVRVDRPPLTGVLVLAPARCKCARFPVTSDGASNAQHR